MTSKYSIYLDKLTEIAEAMFRDEYKDFIDDSYKNN